MRVEQGDGWTLYNADCLDVLPTLPAASVHCVVTSPPYFGLRDYGSSQWVGGDPACDHKRVAAGMSDKNTLGPNGYLPPTNHANVGRTVSYADACPRCGARRVTQEIGSEATPDAYVAALVAVFREVWRVLRDDGTVWLNLGDSYAGGGRGPSGNPGFISVKSQSAQNMPPMRIAGVGDKQLLGIPWRVAFALQADGWILRSDIIWAKPNCMPESVKDRPTKAHEYVFLLAKQGRYFYDNDAVREEAVSADRVQPTAAMKTLRPNDTPWHDNRYASGATGYGASPAGRNKRSVWHIAEPRMQLRDDLTPEQREYVIGELVRRGIV